MSCIQPKRSRLQVKYIIRKRQMKQRTQMDLGMISA